MVFKNKQLKKILISTLILSNLLNLIPSTILILSSESSNIIFDPSISGPEINITSPEENKTYTSPRSGYYPATYNYENEAIGSQPSGWTFWESGGDVSIISELGGHRNVVQLNDTVGVAGDAGTVHARQNFGGRPNGTVELWVRVSKRDMWFGIYLHQGVAPEGNSIYMGMSATGDINYHDGTWHSIASYSPGNWYHFKFEFDCSDDWHLWIDGETVDHGDGYPFWGSPAQFNYLTVKTGSTSTSFGYIDAVGYSWDSTYKLGDNENEGLLLNYTYNFANPPDWFGYSLDGTANRTINGNQTIPIPSNGNHTLQVFGNETITGTMYESELVNFTVNVPSPPATYIPPNGDEPDFIWLIVLLAVVPPCGIVLFLFWFKRKKSRIAL